LIGVLGAAAQVTIQMNEQELRVQAALQAVRDYVTGVSNFLKEE